MQPSEGWIFHSITIGFSIRNLYLYRIFQFEKSVLFIYCRLTQRFYLLGGDAMKPFFNSVIILILLIMATNVWGKPVSGNLTMEFDLSAHDPGKDARLWVGFNFG